MFELALLEIHSDTVQIQHCCPNSITSMESKRNMSNRTKRARKLKVHFY